MLNKLQRHFNLLPAALLNLTSNNNIATGDSWIWCNEQKESLTPDCVS